MRISLSQALGRSAGIPQGGNLHSAPGHAWQLGMIQSVLAYGNQAQGSQRRAVKEVQEGKKGIPAKAFSFRTSC